MKNIKTVIWVGSWLLFAFNSIMPPLHFNSDLSKRDIRRIDYPDYFRIELSIFKMLGRLLLILPFIKPKYKKWVYVAFGIIVISAAIAHWSVDGLGREVAITLIVLAVLLTPYFGYNKY